MTEFWEKHFNSKQEMWGLQPATSSVLTNDLFLKNGVKNVLVPGIGYGRNAQVFREHGVQVTGIEISKTAIALAQKHYGDDIKIYHGSVTDMPFDSQKYHGIYCHALIHLLNKNERTKLISDCYKQLSEDGFMVFTAITKQAPNYGKGKRTAKDCYELHEGAPIFYYDHESVNAEFNDFGLVEISEVAENQPMYMITCKKQS